MPMFLNPVKRVDNAIILMIPTASIAPKNWAITGAVKKRMTKNNNPGIKTDLFKSSPNISTYLHLLTSKVWTVRKRKNAIIEIK